MIATIQDYSQNLNSEIKNQKNTKILTESTNKYSKNHIFPVKNLEDVRLDHYNPLQYKHSCPSTNEDETYHFGDFGNIIANSEGKAFISIMRKVSLKSLNGRLVIISNSPDKCKESEEADRLADVIGYGQLNVFRPAVSEKANGSQEFFLREVNAVNKQEFETKNKVFLGTEKKNFDKESNNSKKDVEINDALKNKEKKGINVNTANQGISESWKLDSVKTSKAAYDFKVNKSHRKF